MNVLETEVKFYVPNPDLLRDRVIGLGGRGQGRSFEYNLRLDDRRGTLMNNRALLRLRKDRKVRLTYKARPADESDQFKILNEYEVEIDDFSTMKQILGFLGFESRQVYEKYRETFIMGDAVICLDQMPYGTFLEIEARAKEIKKYAARLNLKWEDRILLNYLEIFHLLIRHYRLDFNDLTFDHFKNLDVDVEDLIQDLTAGSSGHPSS